jgi:hypothetical protein
VLFHHDTGRIMRATFVSRQLTFVMLWLGSPGVAFAQVYGQLGVGAGVSSVWNDTQVRPATALALGLQTPGLATLRVEVRGVGNTDTALLAGGAAAGMTARMTGSAFGYLLAAAGTGLYTEGQAAPHVGAIAGAVGGGRLPVFGELRYDYFTQPLPSPPRSRQLLSFLAGVRLGARPAAPR